MLSKKELTKNRSLPLVSGKDFTMSFKTWHCTARTPPEEDEAAESTDPDEPVMVRSFLFNLPAQMLSLCLFCLNVANLSCDYCMRLTAKIRK